VQKEEFIVASSSFPWALTIFSFTVVNNVTTIIVWILDGVVKFSVIHADFIVFIEDSWITNVFLVFALFIISCTFYHIALDIFLN